MSARDDALDAGAAEYVLGLLDGDELAEAEGRLAADGDFAAAVDAWRLRLADLDATAPRLPADAVLWQRIAASLEPARPRPATPLRAAGLRPTLRSGRLTPLWQSLRLWRGLTATASLAAAALLVMIAVGPARQAAPAFVAVLMSDAGRPAAVLQADTDGHVTLIPLAVAPLPAGRALQVWTRPMPSAPLVAIGLMDQVRTVRLDLRHASPARLSQYFAVSLEPAGGSPTGLPTGPVLMQGDLAAVR